MSDSERQEDARPVRVAVDQPLVVEIHQPRTTMETVLSSMATVIAIAALGTAVFQGYQTRMHSRLSVQPILVLDGYWADGEDPRGLRIDNEGIGPAIIKFTSIALDGSVIGGMDAKTWDRFASFPECLIFALRSGMSRLASYLPQVHITQSSIFRRRQRASRATPNG